MLSGMCRRFVSSTLFAIAFSLNFAVASPPATKPVVAAAADDIDGVQPAALDQPRIYLHLHRALSEDALRTGKDDDSLSAIEAFLDTGASGIMLSKDTVQKLKIEASGVTYEDVGVGGSEKFGVTEPLHTATASFPHDEPENADFTKPSQQPLRMQIKTGSGLIDMIAPGMDIAGTPVMRGKVIVMDPKPLADYDKIHTQLLPAGDKDIPATKLAVPLTMVSFAKFTRVTPVGAAGPELMPNPMIGPDPFNANDKHAQVAVLHDGRIAKGTFLLDTGAAASILSSKLAADLGIDIEKVAEKDRFELSIGGLGGTKDAKGLFIDRLEIPTTRGKPIVYTHAPFLISDITVADAAGKSFTLDGVFGMNYLVSSAEIKGGLLPDIGKIVDGPWKMIVIDFQKSVMGLEPR